MDLETITGLFTGTSAALILSLALNALFYKARLFGPNTVPRKDYDAIVEIHREYVEELKPKAVDTITTLTAERDALAEELRAERAKSGP